MKEKIMKNETKEQKMICVVCECGHKYINMPWLGSASPCPECGSKNVVERPVDVNAEDKF